MNSIQLVGNLTKDPETRTVGDTTVCKFRIAVNRRKPKGGGEAKTDYIDVAVWGAAGESCQTYLGKGKKVAVNGRLQIDEVDRKDGDGKAYFTSVIASDVEFLTPKGDSDSGSGSSSAPAQGSPEDLGF